MFADHTTVYVEYPKESVKKFLLLVSYYSKIAAHEVNTQN